ncbi:hypothetical protein BH18ACT15_BH18ACT15_02740 [soil metagenome]
MPATVAAGISSEGDAFTFHELRHTAAAFMIDYGTDPLQVMRRMGHSDIRTTYNRTTYNPTGTSFPTARTSWSRSSTVVSSALCKPLARQKRRLRGKTALSHL